MDTQKDKNIRVSPKGHGSNTGQDILLQEESQRYDYIVRKSEKLTTALYMVSDIIPDREPVKWKMRETAIELLSDITLSGTASAADRITYLRNVAKRIEKIVSFLEIAWATRMLSEMNASIMRDEYLALRSLVEEDISSLLVGNLHRSVPVPPTYRAVTRPPLPAKASASSERAQISTQVSHKEITTAAKQARDVFPTPKHDMHSSLLHRPVPPTSVAVKEHAQQQTPRPLEVHTGEHKMAKDDRRKIILALLKQRSNLTVKDIAKSIPGFSEKTIQREIVAMLGEGLVSRAGEKRWTTYSIAQGQNI